jgi:hypothetical protein
MRRLCGSSPAHVKQSRKGEAELQHLLRLDRLYSFLKLT